MTAINIFARLFGFLREAVIGYQFGTTDMSDSIINAYTIPNFLYLVIGGAFTTAFISIYHKTSTSITDYIRRTFTTILLAITAVTAVFLVFADPILAWAFKPEDAVELAVLKSLYYWMLPSTILLVLSTWMSGVLNINEKYNLSSFAVLVYNLAFLVISVILAEIYGPVGYGIGALFGAVFMFFFLVYGVRNVKEMSFKPSFARAADQRELWKVALPIMIGGATGQLYIMIQRFFTNDLADGVVSAMNYATKMSQFPQALLITAVTTVIFPMLSKKENAGDTEGVKMLYVKGMRLLYIAILPVSVYFYFQAEVVVRVVFEYYKFDAASTAIMAPLVQIFSTTMFFLAANMYVTRFYYAKGNSMLPVLLSLICVFGVNIGVILLLIDALGADAIALATLISSVINLLLLVSVLRWKYQLSLLQQGVMQYVKLAVVTLLLIAINMAIVEWIAIDQKWIHAFVTAGLVALGYVILLVVFRVEELTAVRLKLMKKIRK